MVDDISDEEMDEIAKSLVVVIVVIVEVTHLLSSDRVRAVRQVSVRWDRDTQRVQKTTQIEAECRSLQSLLEVCSVVRVGQCLKQFEAVFPRKSSKEEDVRK